MRDERHPRCRALIFVRDTPRYTGGPRHFEMHYNRQQCSRAARAGDLCLQHAKTPAISHYKYFKEWMHEGYRP